ncbi:prepilin-type N-terminal cleavage/methylation domain-containing protein [Duganella callida]|uniref:Type II secretion system protein n=1 Tax=Duganella callida TaxID=2561932 RepID=A0A4Y9SL08_9BURK|nr:prepilin-type N-terminal cleavage/methylation domain-containing protein [Duganella callida]TFW22392.1 type II secretion system protein [Duganella callida]
MCNKRRQQGVTMVELIIFMVIVGVAVAGILQVLNFANKNSADPMRRKQAMLIAEAYMEEVQQAQFTYCDPADENASTASDPNGCKDATLREQFGREANNTRPYDNINDYVPANYQLGTAVRAFAVADSSGNLVDRDVAGNPLGANAAGATLGNASLSGFTTTLTLNEANAFVGSTQAVAGAPDIDAFLLTIAVRYGTGPNDVVTLEGYRTRYAPQAR